MPWMVERLLKGALSFPHRQREEGSLLALNTRKKTTALGSWSKLPLLSALSETLKTVGALHIGDAGEIRTHAGKAQ